jgi:hypothetical protein
MAARPLRIADKPAFEAADQKWQRSPSIYLAPIGEAPLFKATGHSSIETSG